MATAAQLASLSEEQMQIMQSLELEMLGDMFARMTNSCRQKCIATKYHEGDLSKGEAVCLDRCVAKYLEVHERIGTKLQALTAEDDANLRKAVAEAEVQKPS
ncbi:unnamed protein product [Cyprideis torosa]|uniref:Mitochondrial import inner membrane translocase subunit n=1 Tax=Cyprideis torosa TaxID=163714 RepID=A0A7R8ZG53_9CRUS|nr:unnamed protein product [Cyprideis torosa]CAG0879305.1 unnamed protein product [Cyprideis torosa]